MKNPLCRPNKIYSFFLMFILTLFLAGCGSGGSESGFFPFFSTTHTVTYDANSGTGDVPVDDSDYSEGDSVTVLGAGTLTRAGYTFGGWNARADGSGNTYQENAEIIMGDEDIILYAVWVAMPKLGALVVRYDTATGDAMISALQAKGYKYATTDRTTFEAMSVDELMTYDAVFYAGGYSGDSWAKAIAYLDAGGKLFIADNDVGYANKATVFYQQYLQATYISDSGSDGVLTGMDIMSGINPDISPDPYPDDFTVGAEGVEIFHAPSGNSAGVRVERNGYKAIYLAWEFHRIADADQRTAIMHIIANYLGVTRLVLYGATHASAHAGESWLYEIDTASGSATLIGNIGYAVNGMAYDAVTKKLYGTTSGSNSQFIEINTTTGAGTSIGTGTGVLTNVPTFNASGALFAWSESDDNLIRINVATGAIAQSFPNSIGTSSQGLAFDNSDVLYLVNGDASVYTINASTGVATSVGTISGVSNHAHHGDFHPVTGKYWGLDATSDETSTRNLLVIDIGTLTLENTISTLDDLHVLAFGYK